MAVDISDKCPIFAVGILSLKLRKPASFGKDTIPLSSNKIISTIMAFFVYIPLRT